MPLPALGTIPGTGALDAPPPSPALQDGMSPGPSLQALVGGKPPVPSQLIPPQVLTGMNQAATQMSTMLDSFAQVTPDLAPDWAIVKAALASAMAKVQQAGGGPTSPNAPGPQFPGGGIDQGGFPPLASGGQ